MNLIELSLRRPVFAWILMFGLIVFGAICLNRMGVSQMPDVDFPVLSVSVNYEGAAPEVVESDLVDLIEERLLAIEGIREMRSSARQGSASVTLEFDINRNIDVALQEVQSALSQLRLPAQVDPPVIRKQNPEEDPIVIVSVFGKVPVKELLDWADSFLLDQLRFIPGVGEVGIGGFSQRNLRIWIDRQKLKEFDLSITDVLDAVRTQHVESAAGQFVEGQKELRVRWRGEAEEVSQIENLKIIRRGGQMIHDRSFRIKDVARIEDGLSDIRRLARVDGQEAVAIIIRKQRGTNEIDIAKAVQAKIKSIEGQFPKNISFRTNVDFTRSTESTVNLTIEKLWVAGLITIFVCFLFLGSFQAAINILFSIPTSIIGSFIILYFSNFTLNLFTLLALTLSISIVVDDAIMLLENIARHYRMGKGSYQAALDGAIEVLPAATASTLAVIAVFIPVVFMDGIVGKYFFQFGITMTAAVLISLLEAVTITPMRAAAFLSGEPKANKFENILDHFFEKMGDRYRSGLRFVLRWKGTVSIATLGLFVISLVLIQYVRQEFVPPHDQDIIIVTGQAPPGTSLEKTSELARKIEEVIRNETDVVGFFASVGGGGPGGGAQVSQVFMPLTLKPKGTRESTHIQVMARLREQFKSIKGIRISMRDISARNLSSGRQNPVSLGLRGPDLKVLDAKTQELIGRLESEKLAVDLDSDYRAGVPELEISPDRVAMAARGVSVETIGQVLSTGVGGLRQGRFTSGGKRYDIRFKLDESELRTVEDIGRLVVRNISGNLVPLSELVKFKETMSSQTINRVNRQRAISIYGNLAAGQSQSKVIERAQEIAREILPTGYTVALEGAAAGFAQSFQGLTIAMLMGILVAYMVLAIQFNSFVHPISVLIALPFSISGALLALYAFDVSLNLFSFIGLIVLMGISKKNSIMLVEFTNQMRWPPKSQSGMGLSTQEALLKACPVRLRPIIMTSVATVAAALPLVFGSGMGSEARLPMGLVIVGGTLVSTLLTLYVVPAIYLLLSRFERTRTSLGN